MAKKQTKAQKITDLHTAYQKIRAGQPIKREGRKDGSTSTKPIFDGLPDKVESDVLAEVLSWLRAKNVFADRNNTGSGQIGTSGFYHYGIKDGGDIIGLLPSGQHFELEIKRGRGGTWSKGQQKRCIEIRENNGLYFLIHSVQEIEYYFRDLI